MKIGVIAFITESTIDTVTFARKVESLGFDSLYLPEHPIIVAVGTLVAQRPPHRSVRAELLHTAPTSDAWRRSAGWDGGGGFWHSESSDRPTARTAPMSSGRVGSAAVARGTSAR